MYQQLRSAPSGDNYKTDVISRTWQAFSYYTNAFKLTASPAMRYYESSIYLSFI